MTNHRSRLIEDVGFGVAVFIGLMYGLAEAAARVGVCFAAAGCRSEIPWGLLIVISALVLPKTIGRASAGKLWEKATTFVQTGVMRRVTPPTSPDSTDGEGGAR